MRKLALFAAFLSASASAIPPVTPPPPPAAPPRLLIVISVDQFSADLFDEYRPQFTGGLARLAHGTVFRNGYQSHAATETCPGHSTILTGAHPARTGVIANEWMDQSIAREDKTVYCAEDERVPGTDSEDYQVSPWHLKVPTLGELLKRRDPSTRVVAVAGKDRSAVMMTGQRPDQRWFWDDGAYVTDLKGRPALASIGRANVALANAIAQPRGPLELPAFCTARDRAIPVSGRAEPVGTGRFARPANDKSLFRASPESDGATLAIAAAVSDEMKLGRSAATDVLAIGLSATDVIGHRYGTRGTEMCLQLFSLDRDLAGFFAHLDAGKIDYAVALTADHGGSDLPERQRLMGIADARRVDPNLAADKIGASIGGKLGIAGPVLLGGFAGDIYVHHSVKPSDKARVIAEAVRQYTAHPDVEAVFSAAQLAATPMPTSTPDRWTLIERARASFDAHRSGDLVVLLRRYVTPIVKTKDSVSGHGSVWDYDRRVPILFWRKGMNPSDREQPIETVDIMPTLAGMIGLPLKTDSIDGKCLLGIQSVTCPPR